MYPLFSSIRRNIVISSFCIVCLFSFYSVEAEGQDEEYVEPINEIGKTPPLESCNCVAFRLDDIQGFWLNKPQIEIIETFQNKNLPLTIGIIGGEKFKFGEDPKITNFVKKAINADGSLIEVANHGWEHESFPTFDRNTQSDLIRKSTERISNLLEVTPKVFIPPFNEFDQNTLSALEENNYTHLSSMWDMDPPPYPFQGLAVYNFPETATTGTYNPNLGIFQKIDNKETFEDVKKSIDSNGFAVITMHPQEFSIIEKGTYTNQVDWNQIDELELLIEKIQKSGLNLVSLSQINENIMEPLKDKGIDSSKSEAPIVNILAEDAKDEKVQSEVIRIIGRTGIPCPSGEVEIVRVTNPNSLCIVETTAQKWTQLGIAKIITKTIDKEKNEN